MDVIMIYNPSNKQLTGLVLANKINRLMLQGADISTYTREQIVLAEQCPRIFCEKSSLKEAAVMETKYVTSTELYTLIIKRDS